MLYLLTERLSDANANGLCASIISSGRYYCKYCRYFFHGDQTGNVKQIHNLFKYYGVLLDEDDTGKLANMLGEKIGDPRLRTLGVSQLCPECYRPFYCSADHCDEIQRLQYLSEVCSFWVFMVILYLPLIIAFCIPGLLSYIYEIIIGRESFSKKKKIEQQQKKLAEKIKISETSDKYRQFVVKNFDDHVPLQERINTIITRIQFVQKKIRESQNEDEEDNIITRIQDKLELKKLELTPKESKIRMIALKKFKLEWINRLDKIINTIKKRKKKKVDYNQIDDDYNMYN